MTVAPGWPQDGKGPSPQSGGTPLETAAKEVLPPTLFQLPNLKSGTTLEHSAVTHCPGEHHAAASEPASATDSASTLDPAHEVDSSPGGEPVHADAAPRPERPEVPSSSKHPRANNAGEVAAESLRTSPAEDPITRPIPPVRPPVDTPAGRSWVESIGSHGVVLALLLVVVAAALITGRDGQQDDMDSTLAQHSDLLEFDQGEVVAIPEPEPAPEQAPLESGPNSSTDYQVANWNANPTTSSAASSQPDFGTESPNIDPTAGVTLDPPAAETMVAGATEPGIQTNDFVSRSDATDAQMASSRSDVLSVPGSDPLSVPGSDPVPGLVPASDTVPGFENPVTSAIVPTVEHRSTKTPAKIKNLLQYVPARPASAETTPADSTPTRADLSYAP